MLTDRAFLFGMAALILNGIGYAPYIRGIFRGTVKPQRITWGLWTILTGIIFVNQVLNGGGYSSYFFGSTTLLVTTVFVLSFVKGMGGRSRFDVFVLIAAVVLFISWAFTRDTRTTTIIAVSIDGIAALPTLVKAYKHPHTEAYLQWILAAAGGVLVFFAVPTTDYILFVYPVYVVVMNAAIVGAKFLAEQNIKSSRIA
ncbi:MAG TPA: hypothetical protein PKB15_00480 [Acidimicrobiia bacterium]|nr:hypothetical protein [Acidimicrobiia bacterium]